MRTRIYDLSWICEGCRIEARNEMPLEVEGDGEFHLPMEYTLKCAVCDTPAHFFRGDEKLKISALREEDQNVPLQ